MERRESPFTFQLLKLWEDQRKNHFSFSLTHTKTPQHFWHVAVLILTFLLLLSSLIVPFYFPIAKASAAVGTSANGTLSKLWNYSFEISYYSHVNLGPSAAIADMDPNSPGLEILTGNREYYPFGYINSPTIPGRWFMFKPDGTVAWWKNTEDDEARSSVVVGDLLKNGTLKMAGGTTSGNQIQVRDKSGNLVWKFEDGSGTSFNFFSSPAMADIIPGGTLEVIAGALDGHVHLLDGTDGHEIWHYTTSGPIVSSPGVADLDGDGSLDIAVGSKDGYLYVLSSSGTLKWKYNTGGNVWSSPAIADLDGDGLLDVIVGSNVKKIFVLNGKTGTLKWSYLTGGTIVSSPAVGDIDGDNSLEIVFGSADTYVYSLSNTGTLKWKTKTGGAVFSSPALARRSSEQRLDVYVGSDDNFLYLIKGTDGTVLDKFETSYKIATNPVVGDIDGDGKLEIVVQDRFAEIFVPITKGDKLWVVRDLNSSVTPYQIEWQMFRGNAHHTGVYWGTSQPVVQADTIAPTVVITAPANNATVSGIIAISGTATDNVGAIGVQFKLDGTNLGAEDTVAPYAISWNTTLTNNGAHILTAVARDASGNSATSSPITVTVSNFNFSLSNNGEKSVTQGQSITTTITATLISGVGQAVSFTASGLPVGASASFSPASCSPTCSATLTLKTTTSTPTGSSTITVTATGGGLSKTSSFLLTINPALDTTAPVSKISFPQAGSVVSETITISGTASDSGSGVKQVEISFLNLTSSKYWNGSTWSDPVIWLKVSGTTNWSYVSPLLAYGYSYKVQSRATDHSNNHESPSQSVTFQVYEPISVSSKPVCLSASIKSPQNGKKVSGERLTIVAETLCENSKGVSSVRFEYKSTQENSWKLIPAANSEHPNPDIIFPFFMHWNVSALSDGNYHIRAVALDENKNPDPSPSFISIKVDHADPDSAEKIKENGKVEKVEKVEKQKKNVVVISDSKLTAHAQVEIPAGALSNEETKVTVKLNPDSVPKPDESLKSVGTHIDIELQSGQTQLVNEATLTLPYLDEDKNGLVDGTDVHEINLEVCYFNPASGKWEKIASSKVDAVGKKVSAKTNHFSLFGLFAGTNISPFPVSPTADATFQLGEVYAFPNPAKNGKNPTLHIESGLADKVDLKIYDISGELIHSQQITNSQLQIVDGKYAYEYEWNTSGTASGVYIAQVIIFKEGSSPIKKWIKVAVVK